MVSVAAILLEYGYTNYETALVSLFIDEKLLHFDNPLLQFNDSFLKRHALICVQRSLCIRHQGHTCIDI